MADDEGDGFTATYIAQHAFDTAPTPSSDFVVQSNGEVFDKAAGKAGAERLASGG